MKIDINVDRLKDGTFRAEFIFNNGEVINSSASLSFFYSLVDLGDRMSKIFAIDILSTDHELTIKLIHE